NPKILFAIRVEKPDSGHALMSWLTDYIACCELPEDEKKTLTEWNLDYEESLITTDRYGDKLAVCDLDEFLEALKKERYSNFGLKLTKIILEEIQSTAPHNGCFLKIVTYG